MAGNEVGAEFVGALAVGVVTVLLVGVVGANVELVAPSLTVCVWPRACETQNSNNTVKTKTETRLPQQHLDMILFLLHLSCRRGHANSSAGSQFDNWY
jgi:hypothetical protein